MLLNDIKWWNGNRKMAAVAELASGWACLVAENENGKLKILSRAECDDDEEMNAFLEGFRLLPVVLCLHGSGSIGRLITFSEKRRIPEQLLGVRVEDPNEFCTTVVPAAEGKSFAAMIRNDRVNETLARLGEHAMRVTDVRFSASDMVLLCPAADPTILQKNVTAEADGKIFMLQNGLLTREPAPLSGNPPELNSTFIAANLGMEMNYLSGLAGLFASWAYGNAETPAPENVKRQFLYHRLCARLEKSAVVSVSVLVLLVTLLALSRGYLTWKKNELTQFHVSQLPLIEKLGVAEKKRDALLELKKELTGDWLKSGKTAFYLDRIASLVPAGVALNEMTFHPGPDDLLRMGLKDTDGFNFLISGTAEASSGISSFSTALEKQHYIRRVKVEYSGFDYDEEKYRFLFLVEV